MRQGRLPGYAVLSDPVLGVTERDTFTCAHCNRIVHVKPFVDPASRGGLCKVCGALICKSCVGKGCDPHEEKLKEYEKIGNAIMAGRNPWKG